MRSADELVERWERTATDVEAGYRLGLDDYLNDLDGRRLLEPALAAAPDALRARVAGADARFRAATRRGRRCLWGDATARREGWTRAAEWWYWSVPRTPGPELAEDLAARG